MEIDKKSLSWFPGHMREARKKIAPYLKLADLLLEVRDARAPLASANPYFEKGVSAQKRILLFNKANLANPKINKTWRAYFKNLDEQAYFINFHEPAALERLIKTLKGQLAQRNTTRAARLPARLVVCGLPNTGKTTLLNRLLRKNQLKVGARPGVTRALTWIELEDKLELLDSPGILEPAPHSDQQAAILNLIYAVETEHFALEKIFPELMRALTEQREEVGKVYGLALDGTLEEALWAKWRYDSFEVGDKREKFIRRAIQEFREAKFGRISLEFPPADLSFNLNDPNDDLSENDFV